jgi:hypothetical protein
MVDGIGAASGTENQARGHEWQAGSLAVKHGEAIGQLELLRNGQMQGRLGSGSRRIFAPGRIGIHGLSAWLCCAFFFGLGSGNFRTEIGFARNGVDHYAMLRVELRLRKIVHGIYGGVLVPGNVLC